MSIKNFVKYWFITSVVSNLAWLGICYMEKPYPTPSSKNEEQFDYVRKGLYTIPASALVLLLHHEGITQVLIKLGLIQRRPIFEAATSAALAGTATSLWEHRQGAARRSDMPEFAVVMTAHYSIPITIYALLRRRK